MDVKMRRILLGMKKIGFGKDKWNGFGGKKRPNESIPETTMRELREESFLDGNINNLHLLGKLVFLFPFKPEWDQIVYPSIVSKWTGKPKESNEMEPKWFNIKDIPYEHMWGDDEYWLPFVLRGMYVTGTFIFTEEHDGTVVIHEKALHVNTDHLVQF
jgi:8-oxo-dGTP pyrophosphatase MutT (NUDIX family)